MMTPDTSLFSLDGRVALVTGASRGLGLAMAEGLAEVGAIAVLNGRNVDALEVVASTLCGRGLKAEISPFDVTDHYAAQAAIDAIIARHGRLDILLANTGIIHRAPLNDWTPADWDRILGANLKACFSSLNKQPYQCVGKGTDESFLQRRLSAFWPEAPSTVMPPRRADWLALLVLLPVNLASTELHATAYALAISKLTSPRQFCTARSSPHGSLGYPLNVGVNRATSPVPLSFLHLTQHHT